MTTARSPPPCPSLVKGGKTRITACSHSNTQTLPGDQLLSGALPSTGGMASSPAPDTASQQPSQPSQPLQPLAQPLKPTTNSTSGSTAPADTPSNNDASPKAHSIPPSPTSGGARTPRANKTPLDAPAPPPDGKTSELASDMNGLKVQSPVASLTGPQPTPIMDQVARGRQDRQRANERAFSSSTESSSSGYHPVPPSHLGSSYGSDGFPMAGDFTDDGYPFSTTPVDLQMSAQAAAAVAWADEAIKQLNGTSSVIQGGMGPDARGGTADHSYALPRGYADFVKPQSRARHRSPQFNIHRQSSSSSTATEASTSSEESDLCIPSIEWVNLPNSAITPSTANSFFHSPYGSNQQPQQQQQQQQQKTGLRSPGRMPPPPLRSVVSPRKPPVERPGAPGHQTSLPLGATAHSPGGLKQGASALPGGILPDALAEDDDDEATVGNGRERSPSTSSQSAQSGLDLLWRAAHHTSESPANSAYEHPYDSKGKRKAGAEAVAQWRNSGIPTGHPDPLKGNGNGAGKPIGPPKKRRRSEIQMDEIDPALRDEESQYADESTVGTEMPSQFGSESEEGLDSAEDPEYEAESRTRGRAGVRTRTTTGGGARRGAGGKAGGRTDAGHTNGTGAGKGGAGKKARKSGDSPTRGGGAGGGGGGGRRSSGGGGGGGGAAAMSGGVQCEYVNPLPPYNRCLDVFTRKYDLPRHMARHARREGELVVEGKLSEDKALLWKTIKDKPKVTCNQCGESFTRMDALKRHQTKQHHH